MDHGWWCPRAVLQNEFIVYVFWKAIENLDRAIESGNWEAVAASAAAIVKRNEMIFFRQK